MAAASHTSHLILNICLSQLALVLLCLGFEWIIKERCASLDLLLAPKGHGASPLSRRPQMKLKIFGYGRHHELIFPSSLSSTGRAAPRRSARSCSLRCSSATERTPSRPCTVPAWPKSTWPVSREPRWAVSTPVLYRVPECSGPNWVEATLLKMNPAQFFTVKS